jgi:hypothetical protein
MEITSNTLKIGKEEETLQETQVERCDSRLDSNAKSKGTWL